MSMHNDCMALLCIMYCICILVHLLKNCFIFCEQYLHVCFSSPVGDDDELFVLQEGATCVCCFGMLLAPVFGELLS